MPDALTVKVDSGVQYYLNLCALLCGYNAETNEGGVAFRGTGAMFHLNRDQAPLPGVYSTGCVSTPPIIDPTCSASVFLSNHNQLIS